MTNKRNNNGLSPLEEVKNLLEDANLANDRNALRAPLLGVRKALRKQGAGSSCPPSQADLESHLRAVYSGELAQLFQSACSRLLLGDESLQPKMFWKDSSLPLSKNEWVEAAEGKLSAIPEGALEEKPLATARLLMGVHSAGLDAIATVGHSLRPLPAFDLYRGLDALGKGDLACARETFLRVYHRSPFENSRMEAASNLGLVASLEGRAAEATEWYRLRSLASKPWGMAPYFWLHNAMQAGMVQECEDAAVEVANSSLECQADYIRRTRAARLAGDWTPSTDAMGLLGHSFTTRNEATQHVAELFV